MYSLFDDKIENFSMDIFQVWKILFGMNSNLDWMLFQRQLNNQTFFLQIFLLETKEMKQ